MHQIKQLYTKITAGALALLLLAGCSKNLNQIPQSTATNSTIFGSTEGLQLYANSFYDMLPDISDVYKTDGNLCDYGAATAVPNFIRPGAFTSRQQGAWSWTNLRNVNYFIANCTNPLVAQSDRENFIALARFFRAYFYYGMVQKYGDVPWVSKPLEVNDTAILYGHRDPRAKVMDSVLADLNYACAHLKMASDPTRSQISRWVAYGFKSRVCLYEGTLRRYQTDYLAKGLGNTASDWLQEAATAARVVIDSAGLSLNTANGDLSYRTLFVSQAPVTTEIMLADVGSASLAVLNDANWYFTSATAGIRFSFLRRFINTYLNVDGTPFTNKPGYDTLPFVKETVGRDKRLQQTIRLGNYQRLNSGNPVPAPPVFSNTYTGYMPIKWTTEDMGLDNGKLNTTTICLMRYAEILLNYAEAREELGQLTDDDWNKTIGALRARAGITANLGRPTVVDPYLQANYFPDITDPVLLEIRRERGIELTLEGFRWADLTRWKHGELALQKWNGMYVPALDQLMDLNGDGINDVYFYQSATGTPPSPALSGVTYINVAPVVKGNVNPQVLSAGDHGELHWLDNIDRAFTTYMYLQPIAYSDLQVNPNLGQNLGW